MAYNTPDKIVDFSVRAHEEFVRLLLESFDETAKDETESPIDAARRALSINIPALLQLVGDSALVSLLWGAAGIGRRLPRTAIYGSPRYKRDITVNWDGNPAWMPLVNAAVRWMERRPALLDWIFEAASPKMRQQAFTVTGLASQAALNHVQKTLTKAMAQGLSFPFWYDLARKSLETGPVGMPRAQMVYRFNSSNGFHRGQDMILQDPIVGDQFPYVFVYNIKDSRLSEPCRCMGQRGLKGFGGKRTACFRRDDPAYIRNRTPRHNGCRCHDTVMTIAQAAKLGVHEAKDWLETGQAPIRPAHVPYFEVKLPRFLADERGTRGSQYEVP